MLPSLGLLINLIVTVVAAVAIYAVWVANRKRIAAETVGRAEEQRSEERRVGKEC